MGPLSNITVVEITSEISGPMAGQLLADHGANVIKVESTTGDAQRYNGAVFAEAMGSVYLTLNRNKKSISVNLKTPEGKEILKKLISKADVLLHNMRVPAIDRLGFSYEHVKEINSSIIYCVITGYDQNGIYKDYPVYDDVMQADTGLVNVNSLTKEKPEFVPLVIADKISGLYMSNSILAALVSRNHTGIGQHIEVPMFETTVSFILTEHMSGLIRNPQEGPAIYSRIGPNGRRLWPTSDGYIAMLPYSTVHWNTLFAEGNKVELGRELGVGDRLTRSQNISKVYSVFAEITATKSTNDWLDICRKIDIPVAIVNTIDDLPNHPQLQSVDFFKELDDPYMGHIRYTNPTSKFSKTTLSDSMLAPRLGQHTVEILNDIGYTAIEINLLKEYNIINISHI
jgi:formyl-CoA transferase